MLITKISNKNLNSAPPPCVGGGLKLSASWRDDISEARSETL